MSDQKINEFKKIYLQTKVSEPEIQESWAVLADLLPEQDLPNYRSTFQYQYLFAGVLLFLLVASAGTVGYAQTVNPGSPFYPVKVFSDNAVANILGKPQIKVEKRAQDVIEVSDKSPEELKKATDAYEKALNQAEHDVKEQDASDKDAFKASLKDQEDQLKNINPTHTESKELLNKAVTDTEKVRNEVKGASTSAEQKSENAHEQNNRKEHSDKQKGK